MTFYKNKLSFLALGASVLSIAACSYNHPNAMPSGYNYHHDTYKSPTPPASSKITIEERKYMDIAQAEQFRAAVYDLLERMTMRAGMPPKPVYIQAPDPMTTFYANIDNDLREGMRHIGYAISDTPEGAYIFAYEALPISNLEGQAVSTNNVELTLRVFDSVSTDARQLTEESGQYFIQGADLLNIESTHYNVLPSQEKVRAQQMMVEPAPAPVSTPVPVAVEPVVSKPAMVKPVAPTPVLEPVESKPMSRVPAEPFFAEPEPQIEATPIVEPKKVLKPVAKKSKKPSHDDIIIINHGDKPSMAVPVEPEIPVVETPVIKAPESEDALQEAVPTTKKPVRGRVSLPVEY